MAVTGDGEARFAFITDSALRASLESDYSELEACMSSAAWKAVHILAGSIVEALLVDSLSGIVTAKERERLYKLNLSELVERAQASELISERAANLSHVIREFRNLIHPGRVARLSERVDGDGAAVAIALVNMVLSDVIDKRQQTYGLTAEQVVSKLESDPTAIVLLPHLLQEMRQTERDRLVVDVLPAHHTEAVIRDSDLAEMLEDAYRLAFLEATETARRKGTKDFVRVLREEGRVMVRARELLFRGQDMPSLDEGEAKLVKTHLLARLKEPDAPFGSAHGLAPHLSVSDARILAWTFTRNASKLTTSQEQAMHSLVTHLNNSLDGDAQSTFEGVIKSQADYAKGTPRERSANALALALDDIPF